MISEEKNPVQESVSTVWQFTEGGR